MPGTVNIVAHVSGSEDRFYVDGHPVKSILDRFHSRRRGSYCIYVAAVPSNYRLILTLHETVKDLSNCKGIFVGSPAIYNKYISDNYPVPFPWYLHCGGVDVFSPGNWIKMCGKLELSLYFSSMGLTKATFPRYASSYLYSLQRQVKCTSEELFLEFIGRLVDPRWYVTSNGRLFHLEKLLGLRDKRSLHRPMMGRLYSSLASDSPVKQKVNFKIKTLGLTKNQAEVLGSRMFVQFVARKWLTELTGEAWFDEKFFTTMDTQNEREKRKNTDNKDR